MEPVAHGNPWSIYKDTLRKTFDGAFDGATAEEKVRGAREVVRACSSAAATLALQPLPLLDSALILPIHRRMVRAVVRIYRDRCDSRVESMIFTALRNGLFGPHLTMAGLKFIPWVPVVPDLVCSSVAYALTFALGDVAMTYCCTTPVMTAAQLKKAFGATYGKKFERTYRQSRREAMALLSRNAGIRKKVRELRDARRCGAIGDVEAERRLDAILRAPAARPQP
jgi:uncharacterized protein (DUF697 family)